MADSNPRGNASRSRLKPIEDPLDIVGFVSKGDRKYARPMNESEGGETYSISANMQQATRSQSPGALL